MLAVFGAAAQLTLQGAPKVFEPPSLASEGVTFQPGAPRGPVIRLSLSPALQPAIISRVSGGRLSVAPGANRPGGAESTLITRLQPACS